MFYNLRLKAPLILIFVFMLLSWGLFPINKGKMEFGGQGFHNLVPCDLNVLTVFNSCLLIHTPPFCMLLSTGKADLHRPPASTGLGTGRLEGHL